LGSLNLDYKRNNPAKWVTYWFALVDRSRRKICLNAVFRKAAGTPRYEKNASLSPTCPSAHPLYGRTPRRGAYLPATRRPSLPPAAAEILCPRGTRASPVGLLPCRPRRQSSFCPRRPRLLRLAVPLPPGDLRPFRSRPTTELGGLRPFHSRPTAYARHVRRPEPLLSGSLHPSRPAYEPSDRAPTTAVACSPSLIHFCKGELPRSSVEGIVLAICGAPRYASLECSMKYWSIFFVVAVLFLQFVQFHMNFWSYSCC
jgi:hypothetical protein